LVRIGGKGMSYIVKNCPCYNKDYSCQSKDNITGKYCQNCTDCVIKQITELCNDEKEQETDPLNSSGISLAQKILDLLDIEEINK
jgi:hypothetical protein